MCTFTRKNKREIQAMDKRCIWKQKTRRDRIRNDNFGEVGVQDLLTALEEEQLEWSGNVKTMNRTRIPKNKLKLNLKETDLWYDLEQDGLARYWKTARRKATVGKKSKGKIYG
jgi:hypothetical protein